jgi:hypothetical protein
MFQSQRMFINSQRMFHRIECNEANAAVHAVFNQWLLTNVISRREGLCMVVHA